MQHDSIFVLNTFKFLAMTLYQILVKHRSFSTTVFINQNTYKLLFVSCLAYIILAPNVAFSNFFDFKTDDNKVQSTKNTHFAIADYEGEDDVKPIKSKSVTLNYKERVAEATAVKKEVKEKVVYQNLAFVLNPNLTKSIEIPKKLVAEKMANCRRYIAQFADVAKSEMKNTGVPASVTLAQGLLESDAGSSRLAKSTNNHFGIKCMSHKCKKGHCKNFSDDSHKDFFRTFSSASESFKAHSMFLGQNRYQSLKKLAVTDCTAWANGLQKAGYATDKKYAQKLLLIIDAFDLCRYDRK